MLRVRDKLNQFCNWLTWIKLTNFILIFLIVKLLTNVVHREHCMVTDIASIFFFIFGLICGIALTLSLDRKIRFHLIQNERRKPKQ